MKQSKLQFSFRNGHCKSFIHSQVHKNIAFLHIYKNKRFLFIKIFLSNMLSSIPVLILCCNGSGLEHWIIRLIKVGYWCKMLVGISCKNPSNIWLLIVVWANICWKIYYCFNNNNELKPHLLHFSIRRSAYFANSVVIMITNFVITYFRRWKH